VSGADRDHGNEQREDRKRAHELLRLLCTRIVVDGAPVGIGESDDPASLDY
jgi:hypothetical protein